MSLSKLIFYNSRKDGAVVPHEHLLNEGLHHTSVDINLGGLGSKHLIEGEGLGVGLLTNLVLYVHLSSFGVALYYTG